MFKGIRAPLEFGVVPRFGESLTAPQTLEVGFQARACACRGRWLVYLSVRGVSFSSFGGSNARSARNCFPTVRFVTESDGRRFFSFHLAWRPVTNTRHRVNCVAVRERDPTLRRDRMLVPAALGTIGRLPHSLGKVVGKPSAPIFADLAYLCAFRFGID